MVEWQNYWTHKGHTYGQCMTKTNWDYIYINIPKNSSSWASTLLAHWCLLERTNYFDDSTLQTKIPVVILRDPIERWLSGIAEYVALYHGKICPEDFNNTMLEWVFDRVAFDDHTERQIMFVQNINIDKTIWFYADNNISKNFTSWLYSINELNETFIMPRPENVGERSPIKHQVKKFFQEKVSEPKFKSKLLKYFDCDYELINRVKFYQTT